MKSTSAADVFLDIYREKRWPSSESVSGAGSDPNNTERIIRELPHLLRRFRITSMLDVPCGDFSWMRKVELDDIGYTGVDIVPDLVSANQATYGSPTRRFLLLDLLGDALPDADLILCRDCLFHFSHADVFRAMAAFAATSARYLLTTTFTWWTYPRNANIATGAWTPINLEMPPYELPPPITVIVEGSQESIIFGPDIGLVPQSDRCLGLWNMQHIRERVLRLQQGTES